MTRQLTRNNAKVLLDITKFLRFAISKILLLGLSNVTKQLGLLGIFCRNVYLCIEEKTFYLHSRKLQNEVTFWAI